MPADDSDDHVANLVTQAATLFDRHDNVSRVIGRLEFPLEDIQDNYTIKSDDTYNLASMLRVFIFKEVYDLTQSEVVRLIDPEKLGGQGRYLKPRFNLERVPTQQTLSYTRRRRFSRQLRQFIDDVAEGIRETAREHENVRASDFKQPQPDPDPTEIEDQPLHHYVDNHAPQIFSTVINSGTPAFDTGRGSNCTHADERVIEHQTVMSLMGEAGTRAAYRSFNKFRSNALHHDTHTRAVKSLGTPDDPQLSVGDFLTGPTPQWRRFTNTINDQYTQAVANVIDALQPTGLFSGEVAAAIDVTEVDVNFSLWKDDDDIEEGDRRVVVDTDTGETRVPRDDIPELLRGSKEEDDYGTQFHYATLTVVAENTPIILAVEPVRHNSFWEENGESVSWAEVVDRLMQKASRIVDIDLVMADRAFDSHAVYHVLDQYHDVDYLVPKQKDSDDIKDQIDEIEDDSDVISSIQEQSLYLRSSVPYIDRDEDPTVGEDNHSHDSMLMYVPAENEEWSSLELDNTPYAVFATNRVVGPSLALDLADKYSTRWDIENQYRLVKPLIPSIASRDDRMRYFAFAFSCLLYDLWRLCDHSLKLLAKEVYDDYERDDSETRLDPLFPLADFLTTSIVLMFQGGLDPPDNGC